MKKSLPYFVVLVLLSVRFYIFFSSPMPYKEGDRIRITSKVTSEPIRYETKQYLKLLGLKAYLPLYPEINYGDTLVVEGSVEGDKLTDLKLIKTEPSRNALYIYRQKVLNFYRKSLPDPHSALIAGMVLGSKSNLPQLFWNQLKSTGTAHVVVASGMNVTLIGGFLISLFTLFYKRRVALLFTFLGIWLYALMAGFEAPIVRAAIMGSLAFLSQEIGRVSFAVRVLFVTVFIMLMFNPGWITDLGFLLSFFATLSLLILQRKLYVFFKFVPLIFREHLSETTAAQIGVAPILYLAFGQFNMLSPLINTLILWTVGPITTIGMLAGFVGIVVPLLGQLILFLTYPYTLWFTKIVGLFG